MNKQAAIKWFKQAHHDLEMAEKNISIGGYDVSAFLAHQSVEKLLKAIFAVEGKKIPKIHYIDELARKLDVSEGVINDLSELTIDYMVSRYPDVSESTPYKEYTEEIAQEKVDLAKRIFDSLRD
ncbi:MAG: HEPN domain-containing protein [Theionarchaea archaeon]|nr:HEPN domain-containing protein [Theionarchaea archaeon]